jgi:hypothetical protein
MSFAFASRPERSEVDEPHLLDRRFVDFGVIDIADLQIPLIELVVHGSDDLIRIVLYGAHGVERVTSRDE